MCKKEVLKI